MGSRTPTDAAACRHADATLLFVTAENCRRLPEPNVISLSTNNYKKTCSNSINKIYGICFVSFNVKLCGAIISVVRESEIYQFSPFSEKYIEFQKHCKLITVLIYTNSKRFRDINASSDQ